MPNGVKKYLKKKYRTAKEEYEAKKRRAAKDKAYYDKIYAEAYRKARTKEVARMARVEAMKKPKSTVEEAKKYFGAAYKIISKKPVRVKPVRRRKKVKKKRRKKRTVKKKR